MLHVVIISYRYYGSVFDNIANLNLDYSNETGGIDENSTLVVSFVIIITVV